MPYGNARLTRGGDVTAAQKRLLIVRVTQWLADLLDKETACTRVIIAEIESDNWGYNGTSATELRKQPG